MALPIPKMKTEKKTTGGQHPAKEEHPPQVDGFKIKGKLKKGSLKDLGTILRSISFLEIAPEKDALNVIYVESRDIDKNPYLFSIVKIREEKLAIVTK